MKRWGLLLVLVTGILSVYAVARTTTYYGGWLAGNRFYPGMERNQALRFVAGPTAGWLPGVLATVPRTDGLLYLADGMTDTDWLAAYYLYPRRLHVRPTALASSPPELHRQTADLGVKWMLHQGRLFHFPSLTPVTPALEDPESFPPPAPAARGLLVLLLTILAAFGCGAFLLARLPLPDLLRRTPLSGRLGLGLLAGLGILGTAGCYAALLGVAGHPLMVWSLTLAGLALLPLSISWLRPATDLAPATPGPEAEEPLPVWLVPWLRRLLPVLLLGLALAPMARALSEPMHHWDERFQWAYKGKILLQEGGIAGPTFQAADRPQLHRRYPLLIPALEAHVARMAGGFSQERAVKGLFPFFFVAMLLVAHGIFRTRLAPATALLLTTLLAALPPFHHATRLQGGPAHTGFADLPLAAFLTAVILLLLPLLAPHRSLKEPLQGMGLGFGLGLLAAAVFLTKPEGVVMLLCILLVCVLVWIRRQQPAAWVTVVTTLAVVAFLALPRLALEWTVPTTGTVGFSGDEDYLARLNLTALGDGLRQNLAPALTAMTGAPFGSRWAFFGLLPVFGLLAFRSPRRPGSHLLLILILGPLAADLLAFVLTGSQVQWHLSVALDRLWIQVVTPVFVVVAGQLSLLLWSES